jgi:uncharacterized OB-fold protein
MGLYDIPMWESIRAHQMALQKCASCGSMHYPPSPVCPKCLCQDQTWTTLGGQGVIMSWAVFHRAYLPAYPPPYNVIVVKLVEGPLMVSNLEGAEPLGSWIGQSVKLVYVTLPDGLILPRFVLDNTP